MQGENKTWYLRGLRDGLPIMLGYAAVGFTLGIAARNAGLTAFQAGLASLLNNASAGEKAGFTVIEHNEGYIAMAIMMLIINARYLLMSCALSQKISPKTGLIPRLIIGFEVTDEIFGVQMNVPGMINPWYTYGVITMALPGWSLGTYFGVALGNVLPANVVSALLFAAGHLPVNEMMFGLTPMIVLRCILLNGVFGLAFGWLYRRYGLRYAMIAHGGCHIVSKLIWILWL